VPLESLVVFVLLVAVFPRALQHLVAEHDGLRLTFRHNGRRCRSHRGGLDILRRGGRGLVAVGTGPLPLLAVLLLVRRLLLSLSVLGRTGGRRERELVRPAAFHGGSPAVSALTAAFALLLAAAQILARLRLRGGIGAAASLAASLATRLWGVREPETGRRQC
jgi:hypothetical protein